MKFFFFVIIISFPFCCSAQAQWSQIALPDSGYVYALQTLGGDVLAAVGNKIFRSHDDGLHWSDISPTTSRVIKAILQFRGLLLAGSDDGDGTFLSSDNGLTWKHESFLRSMQISCFGSDGVQLFAGTYRNGVYRSLDSGVTWQPFNHGFNLFRDSLAGWEVTSLVVQGPYLFAGTMRSLNDGDGVFRSDLLTPNWSLNTLGVSTVNCMMTLGPYVLSGTYNFEDGTGNGLDRSSDSGIHWHRPPVSLADNGVICLAWNGNILFAGQPRADVSFSLDTGLTWEGPLGLTPINYYDHIHGIAANANYLFIAVSDRGLFRRLIPDLSKVKETTDLTGGVSIFPNPSNGIGNLSYSLSKSSIVRIEVFNANGKLVQVSKDGMEQSGNNNQKFDLSHLSSGEYFVLLQTGEGSYVRAIQVVR